MPGPGTVDILNELLRLEEMNFARRLLESTMFVSHLAVEGLPMVERMARASDEHRARLTHQILLLDGVPAPRSADASVADLHFQELRHVLPRLIADREKLVHKYALALQRLGAEPQAAPLVQRILESHRQELALLRKHEPPPVQAAS